VILAGTVVRFFGFAVLASGINIVATSYYTAINQPLISAGLAVIRSLAGIIIGLAVFPGLFPEFGIWMPLVFTEILTLAAVIVLYAFRPMGLNAPDEGYSEVVSEKEISPEE
jgi:Na+-driven multidrug efflux pump